MICSTFQAITEAFCKFKDYFRASCMSTYVYKPNLGPPRVQSERNNRCMARSCVREQWGANLLRLKLPEQIA